MSSTEAVYWHSCDIKSRQFKKYVIVFVSIWLTRSTYIKVQDMSY